MIDHCSIPVRDLARSTDFYSTVLAPLGYAVLVRREATVGFGKRYPELWLNHRPNGVSALNDSGHHLALRGRDSAAVDLFYVAVLDCGGRCDGPPGPRSGARVSYYGAFIRDPDGNRIEALTFPPPA